MKYIKTILTITIIGIFTFTANAQDKSKLKLNRDTENPYIEYVQILAEDAGVLKKNPAATCMEFVHSIKGYSNPLIPVLNANDPDVTQGQMNRYFIEFYEECIEKFGPEGARDENAFFVIVNEIFDTLKDYSLNDLKKRFKDKKGIRVFDFELKYKNKKVFIVESEEPKTFLKEYFAMNRYFVLTGIVPEVKINLNASNGETETYRVKNVELGDSSFFDIENKSDKTVSFAMKRDSIWMHDFLAIVEGVKWGNIHMLNHGSLPISIPADSVQARAFLDFEKMYDNDLDAALKRFVGFNVFMKIWDDIEGMPAYVEITQ